MTEREKLKKQINKVHGFPYFKYFDVDADGIRCASKSWKISEVANVK